MLNHRHEQEHLYSRIAIFSCRAVIYFLGMTTLGAAGRRLKPPGWDPDVVDSFWLPKKRSHIVSDGDRKSLDY